MVRAGGIGRLDEAVRDMLELTEPLLHVPAERRHDRDPEVRDILERTTAAQMEAFVNKWGRRPEELVASLFDGLLRSLGEERFDVEPRPLVTAGRVDTDVGARVRLRGSDPGRGPFLYMYVGTPLPPVRRVVEFGMRFGPLTGDGDACVGALNEPDVVEMTEGALEGNIDMTSAYGSDLDLEAGDDAHITRAQRWGHRAAFTVGYGARDLPPDLAKRFEETVASLWGPFLRASLA